MCLVGSPARGPLSPAELPRLEGSPPSSFVSLRLISSTGFLCLSSEIYSLCSCSLVSSQASVTFNLLPHEAEPASWRSMRAFVFDEGLSRLACLG